jgi:hypothetical protein
MLKQLNFYGKQTQASHIRKDLWQPFAAVTCPTPEFGMNVYQKLREYRHVRDYNWTFGPTRREIAEAVHKAREKAKEEGKYEIPTFDRRLPTLKERGKLLMDQKASAIADLAHIIGREAASTKSKQELVEKRTEEQKERAEAQWQQVVKLATKAREGELEKYEGWITNRVAEIERTISEKRKARGKKGLMMLKIKRNELLRAKQALDFVEGTEEVPLNQRLAWNQKLSAMVQERTDKLVNPQKPPVEKKEVKSPKERFPKTQITKHYHKGEGMVEHQVPPSLHPSNARIDPRLEPYIRETRGLEPESVLIQWRNIDDALYARLWPKEVAHELVRKELLVAGNRFSEERVPDSAFPGNENVIDEAAEGERQADVEEKASVEKKAAEEEKPKSWMGRFRDSVRAPFGMNSIKRDEQEAKR